VTGATERTGADVTKLPASFGLFMLPSHERTVEVRRSAPDANRQRGRPKLITPARDPSAIPRALASH